MQLMNEDDQVVASLEEEPLAGRYPTSSWQAGEMVQDHHTLVVPDDVPAGAYQLIVGLYRATDRLRLGVATGLFELAQQDAFDVREIVVQ